MKLYEIYFLESRFKREIEKGNLSDDQIKALKKAKLIKTKKEYMKGINLGIRNKIKKTGVKFSGKNIKMPGIGFTWKEFKEIKNEDPEFYKELLQKLGGDENKIKQSIRLADKNGMIDMGPAYIPETNKIHVPKKIDKKMAKYAFGSEDAYKKARPFIKSHEIDEKIISDKIKKIFKLSNPESLPVNLNISGGAHIGPEVLKKEKKLLDFYTRVYDKLNYFYKLRKPEYEELKKYGFSRSIRKARIRGLKNTINSALETIQNQPPETKKEYAKAVRSGIIKTLKMFPKNKRNLKFIAKAVKILRAIG